MSDTIYMPFTLTHKKVHGICRKIWIPGMFLRIITY
uniref:Uncharacterized protein n=1 Tax=Arundo donax TaxID=35708 RepID=A0A0A9B9Q0_ARUDO